MITTITTLTAFGVGVGCGATGGSAVGTDVLKAAAHFGGGKGALAFPISTLTGIGHGEGVLIITCETIGKAQFGATIAAFGKDNLARGALIGAGNAIEITSIITIGNNASRIALSEDKTYTRGAAGSIPCIAGKDATTEVITGFGVASVATFALFLAFGGGLPIGWGAIDADIIVALHWITAGIATERYLFAGG